MAGDIKAGKATVSLYADNNPLSKGLRVAAGELKSWRKSITRIGGTVAAAGGALVAAGTAEIGALFAAASSWAAGATEIERMSQRTGIAVDELARLKFAADQSGIGFDEMEGGIKKMQKALVEGSPAFNELGLSAGRLKQMAPDEALAEIAAKMSQVQNPTKKAALAMQIFGKSGTTLIPMLDELSDSLDRAKKLHIGMDANSAREAVEFTKSMKDLKSVMGGFAKIIGSAVAPVFKDLANWLVPILVQAKDWLKANKGLAVTLLKVSAGVVAVGGVVLGLGTAIIWAGAVVTGFAAVLKGLAFVAGKAWIAVTSPIALTIGALGLLAAAGGAAFLTLTNQGQVAATAFSEAWGGIKENTITAWDGIVDAMKAGDLALAAKIAWAGLKAVWAESLIALKTAWIQFKDWITGSMESIWTGIAKGMASAIGRDDLAATLDQMQSESDSARKRSTAGQLAGIDRSQLTSAVEELNALRQKAADERANGIQGASVSAAGAKGPGYGLGGAPGISGGTSNAAAAEYMTAVSDTAKQTDLLADINKGIEDLIRATEEGGVEWA